MKENLPFKEKAKSYAYLSKEFLWHTANLLGLTKPLFSKQNSRAVVRGYRDYFRGRFSKWNEKTGSIIFPKR